MNACATGPEAMAIGILLANTSTTTWTDVEALLRLTTAEGLDDAAGLRALLYLVASQVLSWRRRSPASMEVQRIGPATIKPHREPPQ